MKVLLTGGAGYIGRVMTSHLLRRGEEVCILDKMIYGNHVDPEGRIRVINADINDTDAIEDAMQDVDAVLHLAAIVGDEACNLDAEMTLRTNYLATSNIAQWCGHLRKPLVFFSTCSVYGANANTVLDEEGIVNPLSTYAKTKLAAEAKVKDLAREHLIFRLGTVFGVSPRMRFDLVVNRMIAQAALDGKITVFGGEQFRPFIHIADVVSNTLKAISSGARGLYNLGGTNHQIREIGAMVRDATGCKMTIIPEKKDSRNYAVDSSKAEDAWGATFPKNVESAVEEIESFVKHSSIRSWDEPVYNNAEWLRNHHH